MLRAVGGGRAVSTWQHRRGVARNGANVTIMKIQFGDLSFLNKPTRAELSTNFVIMCYIRVLLVDTAVGPPFASVWPVAHGNAGVLTNVYCVSAGGLRSLDKPASMGAARGEKAGAEWSQDDWGVVYNSV